MVLRENIVSAFPILGIIALSCFAPFVGLHAFAGVSGVAAEAPYLAETNSAMTKMMADMGIDASGNIDRDFVSTMVPHHQGAIDMAQAELRYGHNELLRRIAQEIIVTQQQEIAAMRLALDRLPPSVPAAGQVSSIKRTEAQPVHTRKDF